MLRKAEEFRRSTLRPAPRLAKPKVAKRPGAAANLPGVGPAGRKRGLGHTEPRNESRHADRKASFILEDSATGKPSRKSTRKSSNRMKPDSNLERRQTRLSTSARSRALRGK